MWKVPSAHRKAVSFALTKVKSRYGGRYGFLKILYELLTSWLYWATPTFSILPTGFGCYKECWKLVQCGQWGKCWGQYWLAVGLSTTKTNRLCLFRAGGWREGWPWGGLSLEGVWISADCHKIQGSLSSWKTLHGSPEFCADLSSSIGATSFIFLYLKKTCACILAS